MNYEKKASLCPAFQGNVSDVRYLSDRGHCPRRHRLLQKVNTSTFLSVVCKGHEVFFLVY